VALRSAEQATITYASAERKLMDSILDPEIIDKQKSLNSRRHAIGLQLLELEEETEVASRNLSYAKSVLEGEESAVVVEGAHPQTTAAREKNKQQAIREAKRKLDEAQAAAATVFGQRDRLKSQLSEIDREQQELNRQQLIA
jgi:hypothetical protein